MTIWPDVGVAIPELLLPAPGVDPAKFAVIACDQYTAEPEYWQRVEALVGDAPSALRLIYPEVYLNQPDRTRRIAAINQTMADYLRQGVLTPQRPGLTLVRRRVSGGERWGLVLAVDLERYDFHPGAKALIRATEGTILSRIPPRVEIRRDAPAEFPHIMLLIDDPRRTVIEPLRQRDLPVRYDFELMLGGGRITGYEVSEGLAPIHAALSALAAGAGEEEGDPMLFAVGDGNHSLATAKACWEAVRATLPAGAEHPARYALVEVVNLHDPALVFEPIHRVVFGAGGEVLAALRQSLAPLGLREVPCAGWAEALERIRACHGFVAGGEAGYAAMILEQPRRELPVATLQEALDALRLGERLDYVHGDETAAQLGARPGNACFLLPGMDKSQLFPAVAKDGVLPRKTFSMGHAQEKRYYMEGRILRSIDNTGNLR